jgi:Ferritin-like domain
MKTQNTNFSRRSSRRSMVKGTVAGVAGVAAIGGLAVGGVLLTQRGKVNAAHADSDFDSNWDQNAANRAIAKILNIAITAEELAVIFYSQALKHTGQLNFSQKGLADIRAALFEEQAHQLFLAKQGAKALTHTFSFPDGQNTFNNGDNFFKVQQQLEALFVAAYLAAGKELANMRRPDLVQIAAQIGGVEAEHRIVGRALAGKNPADNRVFETVLLKAVGDAPAFLKNNGYLSPKDGNSFTFQPIDMDYTGLSGRSYGDQDWD